VNVEVIVPWLAGCRHREGAWRYISAQHRYPTRLAYGTAPWVKALAVRPALEASDADIVIVADADCWTEGLELAVAAVADGEPWAIPHGEVIRLTEQATRALLDGGDPDYGDTAQPAYRGYPGGGFVVAPRETLLEIPLDPLFVGWGQEDEAWAIALTTLAGQPWRGGHPLIHLWHPPQRRENRVVGNPESWRRRRRYLKARGNHEAMRALVTEGEDVAIADIISQPCVIYRTTASGSRDAYGRPAKSTSPVTTVWAVQQRSATEPEMQGELSDAHWRAYFLPTEAIAGGDTVYDTDLGVFEVTGDPWPVENHYLSATHHIEANVRRTAGPEDGS